MDVLEKMVNNHADAPRINARARRIRRNLRRVAVSALVSVAALIVTAFDLMHPGLGVPLMIVSLMVGCYNLGRCVRFRWGVR